MVNLQKLFCSMAGSLALFLGSAGAGVRVLATEQEPADAPGTAEATEATAETSVQEEAELFESGCAYADSGDEFSFSASKTRYEMGEKIVVSIHTDPSDEVVSLEYTAEGFRVSAPRETAEDQIEVTLTHDIDCIEPQFTIAATTQSGEVKLCRLYGAYTECGLYVSSSSAESAWGNYYYDLYSHGTISEEEFYAARMKLFGGCVKETVSTSAPSASVYSVNATNTVNATLKWEDISHVTHPLQYTKTEIWDVYHGALLGTVYTDVNGQFTFRFENSYVVQLRLRVFAEGENSSVTDTNGKVYTLDSSIYGGITPGATTSCSFTIDMSNEKGQAFQISQAVITAARYATEMNGKPLSDVKVEYYTKEQLKDAEGCFYRSDEKTIYIENTSLHNFNDLYSYSSWDAIMHEYGHHIEALTKNFMPGYSSRHWLNKNLADLYYNKSVGIYLAWQESLANVLGEMAQEYFSYSLQNIKSVADAQISAYNFIYLNLEDTGTHCLGEASEDSVCGALWDLFDSNEEEHDKITIGHEGIWRLLKGEFPVRSFSDFATDFASQNSLEYISKFGAILEYYGMAASNIRIDTNTTYPSFSWTANGTSDSLQNTDFQLIFYDKNDKIILTKYVSGQNESMLTANEWAKIINAEGESFSLFIKSYQKSEAPYTGPYYSQRKIFTK